jgi:hypothetical protein
MDSQRPKEGDEKACVTCGHPAIFYERVLKSQPTQTRDYLPRQGEYQPSAGWVCTANLNHFEPVRGSDR